MSTPKKEIKDKCEGCGDPADEIGGLELCDDCGETYHSDDCMNDHRAEAHPEPYEGDEEE